MIRRWSCLININNNFNEFNFFKKKHKINLFKNSVSFKRFNYKFTKFKRRSLIRFKHKSNWLIYTNVIKLWIKDFKFNKNYLKYQFLNKIFINNFFFYNFNFTKFKKENFFYNFNFIFYVFTKKTNSYFFKNPINYVSYSSLSQAWLNHFNLNITTPVLYSSWDNLYYNKTQNFDFNDIFDIFFNILLKKNIEIRKILILLFLNNITNFKKVK